MIYEKALKELNTVFPKLNIKPPTKKATVRPIIQQIQCSYLSNNDFTLLKDPQTAQKPLEKLMKLIKTWQKVIQQNERARQQYESKPISQTQLQSMEYLFKECGQIDSKSSFIAFIKSKESQLCEKAAYNISLKDYKQINICKQIQFYNTITLIPQQQYFRQLEQLNEKLGVLGQCVQKTMDQREKLQQLNEVIGVDELFKKKDNALNRVINFNLVKALELSQNVEKMKKVLYYYEDMLTFSIARCYYLLYLNRKQIEQNKNNTKYLQEILKFISEKPERIFTKLYQRKITKSLAMLQHIRQDCMWKFVKDEVSPQEKRNIIDKINDLEPIIKSYATKPISQQQFMKVYEEVQNLTITIQQFLNSNGRDQQLTQGKKKLTQHQNQLIVLFAYEGDKSGAVRGNIRRVLSKENSRKAGKAVVAQRKSYAIFSNKQFRNTLKANIQELPIIEEVEDKCQDIFITKKNQRSPSFKNQKDKKVQSQKQFVQQCKNYLEKIQPNLGQLLQDQSTFSTNQLNRLIQSEAAVTSKQQEILTLISKNLIKPQISQQNLHKIFKPSLRYQALKTLSDKLVELHYKIAKMMQNTQFNFLPENIKKFMSVRYAFLKIVNKNIENVKGIANVITQLKYTGRYDICEHTTYEIFLKTLLAEKQTKAYQLAFKDQKVPSKQTSFFVNNKIYQPFIEAILQQLPSPFNSSKQIVNILDDLQLFKDLIPQTDQRISQFITSFEGETDKKEVYSMRVEMIRVLGKWIDLCEEKLKVRHHVFYYQRAERQLLKLNQIIKACNNVSKSQLQDPTAIKIAKIIQIKA